jgi:scyllo-inositol 2-dehydrogenase (NADP+)
MSLPITVGLASYGLSGQVFHAPLIHAHPGFRLACIVERSATIANKRYPDVRMSRSVEELCADPEIDLVVVNTPDATHYAYTALALRAGKHVIVEKPLTQNEKDASELIELAATSGKMLSVFQNRRWDGDFLTVQSVLRSGALGRLVEFKSHFDRYRPVIQSGTWKERADAGSGLLFNLGSHMIDQALVLFGMPKAVTAHIRTMRSGGEVDDWFKIQMHYDAVNVGVNASYLVCAGGPRYVLHGTNGTFMKYGLDPQEDLMRAGRHPGKENWGRENDRWWGTLTMESGGKCSEERIETIPGNYLAYYDNIFSALTNNAPLAVTAEDGRNVIRVIEAAKRSSIEKRTIELEY